MLNRRHFFGLIASPVLLPLIRRDLSQISNEIGAKNRSLNDISSKTIDYLVEYIQHSPQGVELWFYPSGNGIEEKNLAESLMHRWKTNNRPSFVMIPRRKGNYDPIWLTWHPKIRQTLVRIFIDAGIGTDEPESYSEWLRRTTNAASIVKALKIFAGSS